MGGQPGPNGPFRALRWYPKGPRVGQLDLLSCIIHVRSVLGPFEPFQSIFWRACQFLPVEGCPGPKKLFCLWWKIFNGVLLPSQYQSVNWSLRCILGHFEANQRICFWVNWPYVYSLFWPFLPYFCYLWPILTLEHQKCTYSIILDAKMPAESEKIRPHAYLKFWVPERPKNPKLPILTQKWLLRVKNGPDAPNGV